MQKKYKLNYQKIKNSINKLQVNIKMIIVILLK